MLIALGTAFLVSLAAFIVMRLYMRRIFRESQRGGSLTYADAALTRLTLAPAIGPLQICTERSSSQGSSAHGHRPFGMPKLPLSVRHAFTCSRVPSTLRHR